LDKERLRGGVIEKDYLASIDKMRRQKIGEIYWIMKESRQEDKAGKKDEYCYVVHNYLLCLYLEDYKEDELEPEIRDRQKQIH